jgi:pimeloyl-ACP methyl ester carboxylesterase
MTPLLLLAALVAPPRPSDADVTFKGVGGLELSGTLSVPDGLTGRVPGLLLLPGSGPTDRDGNQPPVMIVELLKQASQRLTKEGFVTLRFDKRAVASYQDKWPKDVAAQNDFFSWESFVGDAKAALDFLRSQPQVDPGRVIVIGHSEGSVIAMQLGRDLVGKQDAPAGLVLVGAPGRPTGDLVREQVAANVRRAEMSDGIQKQYNDYVDKAIKQVVKDGTIPPDPPRGLAGLFPASCAKLLRSYFTTDPAKLVTPYDGPVLIVQGEKDIQVSTQRDTRPLEEALRARPKGTVDTYIVPGASHNLKHVEDQEKQPGFIGPVVPEAFDKIVSWLKSTFAKSHD